MLKTLITKRSVRLSSKSPIGYIDIRVFAHATEDPDKVLISVKNTLPIESREDLAFKKTALTGYYKNPIILYQTRLIDKNVLLQTLKYISANLDSLDKEDLAKKIKIHLEKKNLYLRFDKQLAYNKTVKFSAQDPIHFKIHFKSKTSREIIELCKDLGLLQ
jgi:RNA binding exosome subunit